MENQFQIDDSERQHLEARRKDLDARQLDELRAQRLLEGNSVGRLTPEDRAFLVEQINKFSNTSS